MTSVGENEEKANTIQPPLLVFFSPSLAITNVEHSAIRNDEYVTASLEYLFGLSLFWTYEK